MIEIHSWQCFDYRLVVGEFGSVDMQIAGYVFGDPRFEDGEYIVTSRVISSNGRSIVTESGTHYWLTGDPEKEWIKLLNDHGICIDKNHPFIKMVFKLT